MSTHLAVPLHTRNWDIRKSVTWTLAQDKASLQFEDGANCVVGVGSPGAAMEAATAGVFVSQVHLPLDHLRTPPG